MKLLPLVLLLASAATAHAGERPTVLRCHGDTNYADQVDLRIILAGNCEGNEPSKEYYCRTEVRLLAELEGYSAGSKTNLEVRTPDGWLVFRNKLLLLPTQNGQMVDLTDRATPLKNLKLRLNVGGGRTWGGADCQIESR